MTIQLADKVPFGVNSPIYGDMFKFSGYAVGNHYGPALPYGGSTMQVYALVANTIIFVPFVPLANHTFKGISSFNTSTAENGWVFRVGIYDSGPDFRPLNLLVDGGQITLTAAAALRTVVINQALLKNRLYWIAAAGPAANMPTLAATFSNISQPYCAGLKAADLVTSATHMGQMRQAHAYGALPAVTTTPTCVAATYKPFMLLEA